MQLGSTRPPRDDLDQRRERLIAAMEGRLAVVHGRANIRYLTGHDGGAFPPWLVLGAGTAAVVHYSVEATALNHLSDLFELVEFKPGESEVGAVAGVLAGHPPGQISGDLTWWGALDAQALSERIGLQPSDCSAVLQSLRVRKTVWEQSQMRAAGEITTAVMGRIAELAQTSPSSRELASVLYQEAIMRGSGPLPPTPYVAVGRATYAAHSTWDTAEEVAGPYLFEFAASKAGYSVPLCRSFTTNPRGAKAYEAIELALQGLKDILGPGLPAVEADRHMRRSLERSGYTLRHRPGYSIGLGDVETWMEGRIARIGPDADFAFEEGMTFHIVAGIREPGHFGVGRSMSVLVSADGFELLAW